MEYLTRNKSKIKFESLILCLLLLLACLYFCVLPIRDEGIRHVVVAIGSVLFYLLAFYRMFTTRYYITKFFLLFLLSLIVFYGLMFNKGGLSQELLYGGFNFLSLLIIVTTERHYALTDIEKRVIFIFVVFSSCLLVLLSFSSVAYVFSDGTISGSLVLGMTNPNLTGMLLSGLYGIILIYFPNNNYKLIIFILSIILLFLIYLTGCRTALITSLVLTCYSFKFVDKKLPNFIVFTMVLFPLLIVPMYLFLYAVLPADVMFLGKPFFSGRQIAMANILTAFVTLQDFLIGDIEKYTFVNAGSAALSVYLSTGIIGVIITYYLYLVEFHKANVLAKTRNAKVAVFCFLCFFIQSASETYFFTGIFPGVVFVYIYTIMFLTTRS